MENIPCCALASNPYKDGRVVYETPNFFVSSALGSMDIQGYLLIVSKEHYLGTGDIPSSEINELDDLIQLTRQTIEKNFGKKSIVFEHGPKVGLCGWGGCIDHAHLHVVPGVDITRSFSHDLIQRLEEKDQFYRVDRTTGFRIARDISEKGKTSYVVLEPQTGERFICEVGFQGQSQWLRRLVADSIQSPYWNWRAHPFMDRALKTAELMRGKF